jgi:hypothetical protein
MDFVGCGGGECGLPDPLAVSSIRYKAAIDPTQRRATPMKPLGVGGCCAGGAVGYAPPGRRRGNGCPPCELYQKYYRGVEKAAIDAGLAGSVRHPITSRPQGPLIRNGFCE